MDVTVGVAAGWSLEQFKIWGDRNRYKQLSFEQVIPEEYNSGSLLCQLLIFTQLIAEVNFVSFGDLEIR